jgi:hypothetical protein
MFSAQLFAQTDSASVRVLVQDASEASIAEAQIRLRNAQTGTESAAETTVDGYALFSPIQRGSYEITAMKPGFKTVKLGGVTINVDERRLIRIRLDVAQVSETIEVTSRVIAAQTEQASLGQVVSGRTAVELPLAGRRYTELALLTPGVANANLNPVTRGPGWFVSNGNYHTQNNFLLDGVDNNQGTTNAQALSAQVVQPSPDSIAEFKVQTNSYSAEFGRSAGGVINVSIKSGGNDVHGSGWYFNRDAALAARGWTNNLLNLPKSNLGWNQFGGTIGGPVVKNKLFYFGAYEGFRQSFGETFLVTVPDAAQRRGVFGLNIVDPGNNQPFADRTVPASRIDPLGRKLVDLYPDANLAGQIQAGRPSNNFGAQRDGKENTHKFDTRWDYYASAKDQIMGRFSYIRQEFTRDALFAGLADGVGNQGRQYNDNQSLAATWTRVISPTVVNTLRYGLNRTFAEFAHASANLQKADAFGFRGIPAELLQVGGLPLISVTNYRELGTRNFRPQFQRPYLNQIVDAVSIQAGRHFLRTGLELRFKDNTFIDITRRTPAYSFQGRYTNDGMADLLLGFPEAVQLNTVPEVNQLQRAMSFFVQDDFKFSPTVTFNLGMRYEYTTPFYGNGKNVNVNFNPSNQGLLIAGRDGNDKYLVTPDRNNFGPRLGVAWQIVPERVVLRGGYGIFYNSEDFYGSEANLPLNPPQLIQATLIRVGTGPAPVRVQDPIPQGVLSNFDSRLVALRTREREQRSGLIQQWNVATQFQVSRASTFEMAYVGNNGRNLFGLYERNQTPFGVDGSVAANRPFPLWQGIQTGASRARSKYNAFQTKFEHNYAFGLYVLAAYTWASALDQVGAWDSGASPQLYDRFEWARMNQTPKHRYTTAVTYDLPFGKGRRWGSSLSRGADWVLGGWKLSTIVSWRSGLPINVGLNGNGIDPATGQAYRFLARNGGGLRPDRVGEANTGVSPKDNRLGFLRTTAYRIQAINTAGNAARNSAYGPRQFNTDFALRKEIRVTEKQSLEFRWESFNLFNTVNFSNPAATVGNTNFGWITGAGDGRVMQLAIRYQF